MPSPQDFGYASKGTSPAKKRFRAAWRPSVEDPPHQGRANSICGGHCIGLRENLQETIGLTIKIHQIWVPADFPVSRSNEDGRNPWRLWPRAQVEIEMVGLSILGQWLGFEVRIATTPRFFTMKMEGS